MIDEGPPHEKDFSAMPRQPPQDQKEELERLFATIWIKRGFRSERPQSQWDGGYFYVGVDNIPVCRVWWYKKRKIWNFAVYLATRNSFDSEELMVCNAGDATVMIEAIKTALFVYDFKVIK